MGWSMRAPARQVSKFILIVGVLASTRGFTNNLPYYEHENFNPIWDRKVTHAIEFKKLINQDGEQLSHQAWQGKITLVNFFFTGCPGLCHTLMKRMSHLEKTLPKGVHLASITVNPGADTPQVLKLFRKKYWQRRLAWQLYTGQKQDIIGLAKGYFFAKNLQIDDDDIIHNELFYLLDRSLKLRGIYNGTLPLQEKNIIADVKALMASSK